MMQSLRDALRNNSSFTNNDKEFHDRYTRSLRMINSSSFVKKLKEEDDEEAAEDEEIEEDKE